jgi:CHAD domain-containing protein
MTSKWIEVASPDMPAVEVARRAIEVRVKAVQRILPLAAHEYQNDYQNDIEHVHQLRVACRRAGAALEAFRPLMTGKPKALRRLLRLIRRAAGPARDLDVLLLRLQEDDPQGASAKTLIDHLRSERDEVQTPLLIVGALAERGDLDHGLKRCLDKLRKKGSKHRRKKFRRFAHTAMQSACRPMLEIAEVAQPTLPQLHKLRIAGKRVRYTIELCHAALDRELRDEAYPLVKQMQDQLGRLNDHATAQGMFQNWMSSMPADALAADLARRVVAEHDFASAVRKEFLKWWAAERVLLLQSHLKNYI